MIINKHNKNIKNPETVMILNHDNNNYNSYYNNHDNNQEQS